MRRFLKAMVLLLLAATALAFAAIDQLAGIVAAGRPEFAVRFALLVLAAIFTVAWWRTWRHDSSTENDRLRESWQMQSPQVDVADIRMWAQRMAHRYGSEVHSGEWASDGAIEAFVDLLVLDPFHVLRATEDVRITGDDLVADVHIEVDAETFRRARSGTNAKVRLVPILSRKQTRDEDLDVSGPTGEVTVLTPGETQGLLYLVLKLSLRMGLTADPGVGLTGGQQWALDRLIRLVCRSDRLSDGQFATEYEAATKSPDVHNERLRNTCAFFARNYVTIVEVPVKDDRQIVIKYTSALPPVELMGNVHDKIRTLVGLRPFRYEIPLWWPFFAENYRLNVTCPDGQFIYQHYVVNKTTRSRLQIADVQSDTHTPVLDLQPNVASTRAGLHMRDFHLAHHREISCRVQFEEVPPGGLGKAVAISAVCSMLALVFAVALPHSKAGGVGSDLAALLLALPAFVATWVGQSAERVQHSSLTTYGGLATAALTSLTSVVLYIVQGQTWGYSHVWRLHLLHLATLPPLDPAWWTMGSLSCGVTLYLAVQARHRMSRYIRSVERRRDAWGAADSGRRLAMEQGDLAA
jgi:hypothetical protein